MKVIEELQISRIISEIEELETLARQLSATHEQMERRLREAREKLNNLCESAVKESEPVVEENPVAKDIPEPEPEPAIEEEEIDIVAEMANSPMNDNQRALLIAAGLIEPEVVPKDAPTEQLVATPEEAEAARKAMGVEEPEPEPEPQPEQKKSSMASRLSARRSSYSVETDVDSDDDDDDDDDGLTFV